MEKNKIISRILFWATIISPIISFSLACLIGEVHIFGVAGIIRYSWIMWLFIPIGLLSIWFGIKLKKNNSKYMKNIIVAITCIILILIFGSYRFIFNNLSYDDSKVKTIENEIKLDLPDKVKIATNKFDYNVSYLKIIDEESRKIFEYDIETNVLWQKQLSSNIKSLLPFDIQYEIEKFDCFIFYNCTNDEYNQYPQHGEYECIFIAYDYEFQRLIILDDFQIVSH